ncbi:NACHT, LRR and PYD domains-containing protein 3-like [Xenia sp. Carnegie-2017]|uniref:NACHT, LRR and PYD domains-containing protein 3-like n=1 Tax=Xenia sp. Carnegie-2017 TaxID=2897299 RepID=UPI001F046E6F|nr:NACHT, LRR and PYD domains-containing protein 3-like [Xenia sp. Carnegie-2017]
MEKFVEYLPIKSFPWYETLLLILFGVFGTIVIGFSVILNSHNSFHCFNEIISKTKETSLIKNIESSCWRQYKNDLLYSQHIALMVTLNVGVVLLLSVVYGYFMKHRVKRLENIDPSINNNSDRENLMAQYPQDAHFRNASFHSPFCLYSTYMFYLTIRLISLIIFVTMFFKAKFPYNFSCSLHETSAFTSFNVTIVNCKNDGGDESETIFCIVATVDVVVMILTIFELIYLAYMFYNFRCFASENEFFTVFILQKRSVFPKWLEKMKKTYEEFEMSEDFGGDKKDWRKLDDIYVNVIMQTGRQRTNAYPEAFRRHEIFDFHLNVQSNAQKLTKVTEIFKPIKGEQESLYPRSILVIGRPGIGKTMLANKIMHEWKNNKDAFWHDKIVLLLRCHALKTGSITLKNMLIDCDGLPSEMFPQIYENILNYPEKAVFIIDGLDELSIENEGVRTAGPAHHNAEMPAFQLLSMLLKGNLLHGSTVLITSRPTAEYAFDKLKYGRTVEILGFFEDQIKEYVDKFCQEDKRSRDLILNCIDSSNEIRSLCYIPVNTYIVCLTLKECFINDAKDIPKTTTELYKRAVKILIWRHHPRCKDGSIPKPNKGYLVKKLPKELDNDMKILKNLAKKGIETGSLIFDEPNLADNKNLADCGLFHQLPDKRRDFYCFLHLTLQEFLTAWCVVDNWRNIEIFLDDHAEDSKWYMVIEFIAGLVGDTKKRKKIEDISVVTKRLQNWISNLFLSDGNKALGFLGMKCLYELQDDDEMRSACKSNNFSERISIDKVSFTPLDSNALFEFLSECRQLKELKFSSCQFLDNHSVVRLSKYLSNATACNVISLKIYSCGVNNKSKHLSEALKIGDEDAKYLSEAMKTENCKLTKLDLSCNNIGVKGAKSLREALKTNNCKLTELYLDDNNIGDEGAKYFSEALKSENFKLTKFDLSSNYIGDKGAVYLSEAVRTENCKLTELYLYSNKIGDKGAKCLSLALPSEDCKHTDIRY